MKNANKKLVIVTIIALVLAVSCVVGTLAYLTAETDKITNTFTYGKVKISLTETDATYKIIPDTVISKDPTVSVTAGSEACYLFVLIEESANLDTYITYTVDTAWTQMADTDYYYISVDAATATAGKSYAVLTGNQVIVPDTVDSDDIALLDGSNDPTLSFTAYAVQAEGFADAYEAWNATFGVGAEITNPAP